MKLRKRNMRHFDYLIRVIFGLSVIAFIFTFVFVQPKTTELRNGNYLLTTEIQQLENRNVTLKREIDELKYPTAVMTTRDDESEG